MAAIFHPTTPAAWQEAVRRGFYAADSLFSEGFIHCSDLHQVVRVANIRFRNRTDLVMLQIDTARLDAPLRYENLEGGDEPFPHVYGALPIAAIVRVRPFQPNAGGVFEDGQRPDLY